MSMKASRFSKTKAFKLHQSLKEEAQKSIQEYEVDSLPDEELKLIGYLDPNNDLRSFNDGEEEVLNRIYSFLIGGRTCLPHNWEEFFRYVAVVGWGNLSYDAWIDLINSNYGLLKDHKELVKSYKDLLSLVAFLPVINKQVIESIELIDNNPDDAKSLISMVECFSTQTSAEDGDGDGDEYEDYSSYEYEEYEDEDKDYYPVDNHLLLNKQVIFEKYQKCSNAVNAEEMLEGIKYLYSRAWRYSIHRPDGALLNYLSKKVMGFSQEDCEYVVDQGYVEDEWVAIQTSFASTKRAVASYCYGNLNKTSRLYAELSSVKGSRYFVHYYKSMPSLVMDGTVLSIRTVMHNLEYLTSKGKDHSLTNLLNSCIKLEGSNELSEEQWNLMLKKTNYLTLIQELLKFKNDESLEDDAFYWLLTEYEHPKEVFYLLQSVQKVPDAEYMLQFFMLVKSNKTINPIIERLKDQPSWVNDEAWKLYNEYKPWKAANILTKVVKDVIKYANGRTIICLARDFFWLYAMLVELEYPCYLGICSRLNIGNEQTLDVFMEEVPDLENALFVDSQGRGSIYDWMLDAFNNKGCKLSKDNFAFLYSEGEYHGICQDSLTRKEVVKKIEHGLIHHVGRSHDWLYHEGLGWQPIWEERELNSYEVTDILQVRALTCMHMGVPLSWNSCIGHTNAERTLGLNLSAEFPGVYVRCTEDAWDRIQVEGYKTLRHTGYSMGKDQIGRRTSYEDKAFNSIVYPSYGYRGDVTEWSNYGSTILKVREDYLRFATTTKVDSLVWDCTGADIQPLSKTTGLQDWKNGEVQFHVFLPPCAFSLYEEV